jgi:hypothetical protein
MIVSGRCVACANCPFSAEGCEARSKEVPEKVKAGKT